MDGEIGLESRLGEGSTFWFSIPLGKEEAKAVWEGATTHRSLRGLNALVVHGQPVNREVICQALQSWGCHTVEAVNGSSAKVLIREYAVAGHAFDLAVFDSNISDMNCEEIAQMIKADPGQSEMVLIMLTSANGNEVDASRVQEAGFSGCLSQPIRTSELYDTIINAINHVSRQLDDKSTDPEVVSGQECNSDVKILLAEDNEINQEVASEILKVAGYSCDIVDNGREAVEAVRIRSYDLVFMDCQMPEMDGYEAARRIREHESGAGRRIPILALTANAMTGDREECLTAGMDDYLCKPLDPDQMISMITKWCQPSSSSEEPRPKQDEQDEETMPLFDEEDLLNRFRGNTQFVEKLIDKFLVQLDGDVRRLSDALSGEDFTEVKNVVHRIKGASANLSMRSLQAIAACIEEGALAGDLILATNGFQKLSAEIKRIREYFGCERVA
jgi:CheY-like chemotaxis protein